MGRSGAGGDAGAGAGKAEASLPWIEKYRPNSLDDLIAHDHIISTSALLRCVPHPARAAHQAQRVSPWMCLAVNRLIDANKLPHLLLYGPPGTGKTSTIVACAKRLYGKQWKSMTLEVLPLWIVAVSMALTWCCVSQLNASDDRGIGVVRDQIKNFAGTMKLFSKGVKLVILDEADAMTPDAQFALRRGTSSLAHRLHSVSCGSQCAVCVPSD